MFRHRSAARVYVEAGQLWARGRPAGLDRRAYVLKVLGLARHAAEATVGAEDRKGEELCANAKALGRVTLPAVSSPPPPQPRTAWGTADDGL